GERERGRKEGEEGKEEEGGRLNRATTPNDVHTMWYRTWISYKKRVSYQLFSEKSDGTENDQNLSKNK
ncbi:45854_t:CDS:2, partial [Gigaspora margarita]